MAIFNKSSKISNKSFNETTVIAHGTNLKGEINIQCNLHIDGSFDGIINADKNVTIGKTGIVQGQIEANKISISGNVTANINTNILYLLKDGKLFGKVLQNEFIIEEGALFEGETKRKNSKKINKKILEVSTKDRDKLNKS
jgi:cytoskeletal protein CcmA (bactofilin family)